MLPVITLLAMRLDTCMDVNTIEKTNIKTQNIQQLMGFWWDLLSTADTVQLWRKHFWTLLEIYIWIWVLHLKNFIKLLLYLLNNISRDSVTKYHKRREGVYQGVMWHFLQIFELYICILTCFWNKFLLASNASKWKCHVTLGGRGHCTSINYNS